MTLGGHADSHLRLITDGSGGGSNLNLTRKFVLGVKRMWKTTLCLTATLIVAAAVSSRLEAADCVESCDTGCGVDAGCGSGFCLDAFLAGDGWKMKADDDDNNNFGFRTGLNGSMPLRNGIRGQLGASIGGYDFYGREDAPENPAEAQVFVTAGVSKRANLRSGERVSWGIVWDYMNGQHWGEAGDSVGLHQVRLLAGYALNSRDEVGFWGAWGINECVAFRLDDDPLVSAFDQYNFYWRRHWDYGGETMIYLGVPDDRYKLGQFTVGGNGRIPLSDRTSVFGGVHYIIPSTSPGDTSPNGVGNSYSEDTWNVTVGLVWSFGPGRDNPQNVPLLPVADNGTFSVTAPPGSL